MSVHLPALTTAMVPELSALTLGVATFAGVVLAMMETELTVKVGKSYQSIQHTKFVYSAIHVPVTCPPCNVKYFSQLSMYEILCSQAKGRDAIVSSR